MYAPGALSPPPPAFAARTSPARRVRVESPIVPDMALGSALPPKYSKVNGLRSCPKR